MNCHLDKHEQHCQPFPESGPLRQNKNLNLDQLKHKTCGHFKMSQVAYVYVVATVSHPKGEECFCQTGSAPNFQGAYITLCTCKHYMRASREAADWQNTWVAGFTPRKMGRNYLFYLLQVETAFDSFRSIWRTNCYSGKMKKAKDASHNEFGDLFRPCTRSTTNDYSVRSYKSPTKSHPHSQKKEWHNDIQYKNRCGKHPPLLVGNPRLSFLWTKPLIYTTKKLGRGYLRFRFDEIQDLYKTLKVDGNC